jgi:hypothetical protein
VRKFGIHTEELNKIIKSIDGEMPIRSLPEHVGSMIIKYLNDKLPPD